MIPDFPKRLMAATHRIWTATRPVVRSSRLRRCKGLNCAGRRPWQAGLGSTRVQLEEEWYCTSCLQNAVLNVLSRLPPLSRQSRVRHRIPLGLLMLARGQITARQLQLALAAQKASGTGRFGAWLQELGFTTESQITAALGRQWACPVLSDSVCLQTACLSLLPLALEESFRILPVHYVENTRMLHVAFADEIEYTVLYAIQQLLGYHTAPCVATASFMLEGLEKARSISRPCDLVFENCSNKGEMSRITTSYVSRSRADQVRIINCPGYVWVRLECRPAGINLLFRERQNGRSGLALLA